LTIKTVRLRRRPTRILLASSAALAAVVLAGVAYAPGSARGAGSGVTITLYNAQHEQTTDALIAAFTKKTGIKVRVENDDEDVLTAQIEQEGTRSPADVFYTENSNWLEQLDERGLLAKLGAGTLGAVPRADSASDGGWVGVSARVSVLVYNPSKIKASQLPTSVLGLAQSRWKGKLEIAPAETDFWPIVDSVAKAKGKAVALKWLQGLRANAGSGEVPDNETLVSDVNQGVTDLGLINHYYFYRLQAEVGKGSIHARIAYFAPHDPGYVEDISGAGVLKSSKHAAAAQAFVNFLTSQAGQQVLAHGDSFEYPIRPGVAADSELTPLAKLAPTDFTPAELGSGLEAKALLQAAGLI
jgi:iron(III) transport system substrate-binding protein